MLRTSPADDVATLARELLARELIDDVRRLGRRMRPGGTRALMIPWKEPRARHRHPARRCPEGSKD